MRFTHPYFLAIVVTCLATGCGSTSPFNWDTLKGPGFPGWTEQNSVRGAAGTASAPKPSGFFTDRRSEQIEQDLGGF